MPYISLRSIEILLLKLDNRWCVMKYWWITSTLRIFIIVSQWQLLLVGSKGFFCVNVKMKADKNCQKSIRTYSKIYDAKSIFMRTRFAYFFITLLAWFLQRSGPKYVSCPAFRRMCNSHLCTLIPSVNLLLIHFTFWIHLIWSFCDCFRPVNHHWIREEFTANLQSFI